MCDKLHLDVTHFLKEGKLAVSANTASSKHKLKIQHHKSMEDLKFDLAEYPKI